MVQHTVKQTLALLYNLPLVLSGAYWSAFALLVLLLVVALAVHQLDRPGFWRMRAWVLAKIGTPLRFWVVALAATLGAMGLGIAQHSLQLRLGSQSNAQYSRNNQSLAQATTQYAPRINWYEAQERQERIVLPKDLTRRFGEQGSSAFAGVLLQNPSNLDPNNQTNTSVNFEKLGTDWVFTRTQTTQRARPIALTRSDIAVRFENLPMLNDQDHRYRVFFVGKYTFRNPSSAPQIARLNFPLPSASGTLSDFSMTMNKQSVDTSDLENGAIWEGILLPKSNNEIVVQYNNIGSQYWAYDPGNNRDQIREFHLIAAGANNAQFERNSLYPNTQGRTLEWNLKNIVTSQRIQLGFRANNERQTLTKVFAFMPLVLLIFLAWLGLRAWRHGTVFAPNNLALAVASLAFAWSCAAILGAYLPPVLALWLGALLACGLGFLALRQPDPALLCAFWPLVFTSEGHAGLWSIGFALVLILSLYAPLAPTDLRTTPKPKTLDLLRKCGFPGRIRSDAPNHRPTRTRSRHETQRLPSSLRRSP